MSESGGLKSSSFIDNSKLRHLKEGDIYVDENGKRYRVHKTVLPQVSAAGPCGEGDPNDRALRRMEADVIIPNRMNKEIERVACHNTYYDLVKCLRKWGDVKGLSYCKDTLNVFNKCKKEKFDDPEFRQRITDQYLEERAKIRQTGKPPGQQRLDAFRQWKSSRKSEESIDTPSSVL